MKMIHDLYKNLKTEVDSITFTITAITITIYIIGLGGNNSPFLFLSHKKEWLRIKSPC